MALKLFSGMSLSSQGVKKTIWLISMEDLGVRFLIQWNNILLINTNLVNFRMLRKQKSISIATQKLKIWVQNK